MAIKKSIHYLKVIMKHPEAVNYRFNQLEKDESQQEMLYFGFLGPAKFGLSKHCKVKVLRRNI